ncbi:MAG: hypothetical protein M0P31_18710 [Solirubrobacteraceae bacterium]|nr:hypothetical protein [Solirubrobacteraceae bacterium]
MLLLSAGVSLDEYRVMSPGLADALSERVIERRREDQSGNQELIGTVLEIVAKRLVAIEGAVRSRPVL